jgi:hypothetical protein
MTPSKRMSWIYGTSPTLKPLDGSVGAITNEALDAERTWAHPHLGTFASDRLSRLTDG